MGREECLCRFLRNYWCLLNFGNHCKIRFAQVSLWQLRRNRRRSGNTSNVLGWVDHQKYLDYGKHKSEGRLTWDDPLHLLLVSCGLSLLKRVSPTIFCAT